MKNPDLYNLSSTAQHMSQSVFTCVGGDSLNLHKYYWYIVLFVCINFIINIIIRVVISDAPGMVMAATAAQVFLFLYFVFVFSLGVIFKDENIAQVATFTYGLSAGIIIFMGITFSVVNFFLIKIDL